MLEMEPSNWMQPKRRVDVESMDGTSRTGSCLFLKLIEIWGDSSVGRAGKNENLLLQVFFRKDSHCERYFEVP